MLCYKLMQQLTRGSKENIIITIQSKYAWVFGNTNVKALPLYKNFY